MSDVTTDSYVRTFANGITVRVEPGYSKYRARLILSGTWREYMDVGLNTRDDDEYDVAGPGGAFYFGTSGKLNHEDQTFTFTHCKVYVEKMLKYLSELA